MPEEDNKTPDEKDTKTREKVYVVLNTSAGPIKLELNADETPKTVENFITLSRKGFYNGTIFHRVIEDFMIQGGDPKGDGTGGPGYTIEDETFTGDYTRGTLAMARTSAPNSAGSQFFIMHKDYTLPKQYVIFGKVIEGIEVVDQIATAPVERSLNGEMSKPINPVTIDSIEVIQS
ncbi:peptidylprolyl isomerase [Patescibacteria group bacterium]|nr:peptidylprolyl isomerase [Patescibacteria group bacterium]